MIGEFHHVGIGCQNLDAEIARYLSLGFRVDGDKFFDPIQRIFGVFLTLGSYRVELIQGSDPGSPVDNVVKYPSRIYHQAFLVDDMESRIKDLKSQGGFLVSKPQPAVAFGGRAICFIMLRDRMLIELIERG